MEQLLLLFAVVESAVQSIDLIKNRKALAAGALVAVASYAAGLNILVEVGIAEDGALLEAVSVALIFLLGMRGTQVVHELIKKLGV